MSRSLITGAMFALLSAAAPRMTAAQATQLELGLSTKSITKTLGVKPMPGVPDDLAMGQTITCTLDEPDKLADHGVKGMHEGARVTITRVATDKIRVEADELEPVPAKHAATLRVAGDGELKPLPPPPAAPKPPV